MTSPEEEGRPLARVKKSWYKDPVLYTALILVFSLDQITKAVIRLVLDLGESFPSEGTFRITHTFNTGSAFGLFPDQTLFLILASFIGMGILLLLYRDHPFPGTLLRLGFGMQLGGALGNLVDRLHLGHVTDFVQLGFWPVFNVADASIVIGIIILAYVFVFAGKRPKFDPQASSPVDQEMSRGSGVPSAVEEVGKYYGVGVENLEIPEERHCLECDFVMQRVPGGWLCAECGTKQWAEGKG